MSDQTQIQTLGPADPNAPVAQKFYTVVSGLLGLVGIASTFGLVTTEQAASLSNVGATAGVFIGAVGTAIASFRTKKQVNNGTFTKAPELPVVSALDQLVILRDTAQNEVRKATAQATDAMSVIQSAVAPAISNAVGSGDVGDLVQAMADRGADA